VKERIEKFLLLLGSDKPGEVAAAAAALCRALKSEGRDLHDLVGALKGGRVVYRDKVIEKTVYPKVEELSPREIEQLCLDQDTSRLNDRERQFLEDMSRRYSTPTPKQEAWLFAIHDKLLGHRRKS
jgi:ABC-type iron transport system FetAB ATPase subunit